MVDISLNTFFPCVRGLAYGELIGIDSFVHNELRGKLKVVTRGVNEAAVARVIGTSRLHEKGSEADMGVLMSFTNNMFISEDFGLAAAASDILARFDITSNFKNIHAIGQIDTLGGGKISPAQNFSLHLKVVAEHGSADDLIIFPAANLNHDQNGEHLIKKMEEEGFLCRKISQIKELQTILTETLLKECHDKDGS